MEMSWKINTLFCANIRVVAPGQTREVVEWRLVRRNSRKFPFRSHARFVSVAGFDWKDGPVGAYADRSSFRTDAVCDLQMVANESHLVDVRKALAWSCPIWIFLPLFFSPFYEDFTPIPSERRSSGMIRLHTSLAKVRQCSESFLAVGKNVFIPADSNSIILNQGLSL